MLFLPGYFFFRLLRLSPLSSLIYAPLFSIPMITLVGLAFTKLGIFCSAASIGGFLLAVTLCFAIVNKLTKQRPKREPREQSNWTILLLYISVGVVAGVYTYLLPLDGPESIVQTYDNVFHYNSIESFIESGLWSILNVDAYLGDQNVDPLPGAGFYPAAWHIISAFTASALGSSAPLSANTTNFVFCSLIFPISIFSLMRFLFPNDKTIIAFGSIACCIQASFPWMLYGGWPLFPNAASLCTMMIAASAFMDGTSCIVKRKNAIASITAFLLGFGALAVLQPNAIFSLMVVLMPYCVWQIAMNTKTKKRKLAYCLLFLVAYATTLLTFFKLPFLQPTITYNWAPIYSKSEALFSIVSGSLSTNIDQWPIAVLIAIGSIFLITKYRKESWIIVSLSSGIIIFFAAASLADGDIKHFISGYWYNDAYRVAAMCSIIATPIIATGINAIYRTLVSAKIISNTQIKFVAGACCSLVLPLSLLIPGIPTSQGIDHVRSLAYAQNKSSWNYLDQDEKTFIEEAMRITQNSLVVNQPFDGSMYAFGSLGANLYYRDNADYESSESETADSKTIRNDLKDISTNEQVEKAVKSVGASYVLLLKRDFKDLGMYYPNYHSANWEGIDEITPETKGFSLILENNGMSLYRIKQ